MKMRCAAIDDEPLALKQISGYISRTPFLELVAAWPGAVEAVGELADCRLDLLFIDIDMPSLNGLDFVRSLKGGGPMVIFTTAYSEYAVEGFRLEATGYLLKPIGYTDFIRAAERALRRLKQRQTPAVNENTGRLFVRSEYRIVPVDVAAISHIESMGEYLRIHIEGSPQPVTTLGSIRSMADRLPAGDFMRIHRSHLVNMRHIASIERGVIVTPGGMRIPVGQQYREEFRQWLERNSLLK